LAIRFGFRCFVLFQISLIRAPHKMEEKRENE
jgi:hypothetical protein